MSQTGKTYDSKNRTGKLCVATAKRSQGGPFPFWRDSARFRPGRPRPCGPRDRHGEICETQFMCLTIMFTNDNEVV
jgi:hypothetical protein